MALCKRGAEQKGRYPWASHPKPRLQAALRETAGLRLQTGLMACRGWEMALGPVSPDRSPSGLNFASPTASLCLCTLSFAPSGSIIRKVRTKFQKFCTKSMSWGIRSLGPRQPTVPLIPSFTENAPMGSIARPAGQQGGCWLNCFNSERLLVPFPLGCALTPTPNSPGCSAGGRRDQGGSQEQGDSLA